ncbi:MAG: hypothetical protein HY854_13010 [Burkholderiales bacterium]|nr:hypothetical protein [Burkholderiales bacterium]
MHPVFPLTHHASLRLQQRGIPPWFLDLLIRHGRTLHDGHGAILKTMDKGARRKLAAVLTRKEYADAERWFDVYAVVSARDDAVITAAHRTNRRFH